MLPTFSKNFAKASPAKEGAAPAVGAQSVKDVPSSDGADSKRKDIRSILAWVIFIISACVAAGMFAINLYLDGIDFLGVTGEIQRVELLVEEQEAAIQPQAIQDLVLFDSQIDTLKELDRSRAGYLVILDTIGSIIIPSVRYTSADINLSDGVYRVRVQATALTLPAYLQQSKVLQDSNNEIVQQINISQYSINRNDDGESSVNFSLILDVPVSSVINSDSVNI